MAQSRSPEREDANQGANQGQRGERANTDGPRRPPRYIVRLRNSPHPWPQLFHIRSLENLSDFQGEFARCRPRTQLDSAVGKWAGTDRPQFSQLPHYPIDSLAQSFTQCNDRVWRFLAFERVR
jgi:hypothetical protein